MKKLKHLIVLVMVTGISTKALGFRGSPGHGKDLALGLEIGSNSLFGNGFTGRWRWFDYAEWQAGLGYNSTGIKVGIGHSLVLNWTRTIGFQAGSALTYSAGQSSTVELDAYFRPEGSAAEESLVAAKDYTLTPSVILGVSTGMFWDLDRTYRFSGYLSYGIPLTGNEVTLDERTTYSKPVDLANDQEFSAAFDRKAQDVVKAGGLGIGIGAALLF